MNKIKNLRVYACRTATNLCFLFPTIAADKDGLAVVWLYWAIGVIWGCDKEEWGGLCINQEPMNTE